MRLAAVLVRKRIEDPEARRPDSDREPGGSRRLFEHKRQSVSEQLCDLVFLAALRFETHEQPDGHHAITYEHDEPTILIDFTVNVAIPPIVSPATPVTVTLWPACLPRSTDLLASPSVDAIPSFIIESCAIESFAMVSFAMASLAIDFFEVSDAIAWPSVNAPSGDRSMQPV